MKVQGGVCNGSERSGRFPFMTGSKGQAHLHGQARKQITSSPNVQLLLPSSEEEDDISLILSTSHFKNQCCPV